MIRIGPAGSFKPSTLDSVRALNSVGLNAMEVEFVYGVTMKNELARKIGEEAKKEKIELSVHAPYYINLSSLKKENIIKSKNWILESCERAHHLNAKHVVFHPGFYHERGKKEVFEIILNNILDIKETLRKRKLDVNLSPETTGKHSAFGDLDETIELAKKARISLCVDFAHLYARNNGRINYEEVFNKLKVLDLKHLHCHFSGINFNNKGERNHLNISSEKPNFKELARVIKHKKMDITIICESPRQYLDAIDMVKILDKV
ncbi:MAG: TIM barrel protein [Candidatus Nanoarchaeia archaeon]|nr:TIM barrel protein [Candidatus Nanoarchaeia archaeon]